MNVILAILFAVSLSNTSIGKFWTMPAGYPRSTSTGDTPGSDGFSREMHRELSKRAAAGYYAVMDGYDTRRYVFSLTNDKPNSVVVNTDALTFYDDFLSRKDNLNNWPVFSSYSSGMVFGKYMADMGYPDFVSFGWTEDPVSTTSNYIGWWPTYRSLNSGEHISCDGAYGGLAKAAFDRLPQMGSITNHDWTADIVDEDMTADAFMEYAFARPVVPSLASTSRELDWRPIEASAAILGAYDKIYELMDDGYTIGTNSTIYGSAVTKSRGGVETLKVTQGETAWTVERIGTGPIDVGSVYTNMDESVISNAEVALSCPSISATKPTAQFTANGSVEITMFFIPEDAFWAMAENSLVTETNIIYITWEGRPSDPAIFSVGYYDDGGHWIRMTGISPYYFGVTSNLVDVSGFDVPVSAAYRSTYVAERIEPNSGEYQVYGFKPFDEIAGYVGRNNACVLSAIKTISNYDAIEKCEYRGDEAYNATSFGNHESAFRSNMSVLSGKIWSNFYDITQSSDIYNAINYTQCRSKFDEAASLSVANISDIVWEQITIWAGCVDRVSKTVITNYVPSSGNTLVLSHKMSVGISNDSTLTDVETRPDANVSSYKSWVGAAKLNFGTQFSGQDGGAGGGHVGGWGTLELCKNTANEGELENAYANTPYYGVEMDEPVLYAKRRSFYGAFKDCLNLHFVHANLLQEADESSFEKAFSGCTSMTNASFNGLPYAGVKAFKEAFVNTKVKATDFASLTNCGAYAFENAYAGDTNLTEISFPSLVGFGTGAFKGAFSNATALTGLRFSSIEYVPTNVFNSSFVDCVALTNVDFGSVKVCRVDAFNGAFEDAKNIENVDFHSMTNCGERAFRRAFAGTEDPQAFKLKELAFDNLVTAGSCAFEEAFAYSEPYPVYAITPHDSVAWASGDMSQNANAVAVLGRQSFLNGHNFTMYFIKDGVKRGEKTCTMSYGTVADYESDFKAVATLGSSTDRFGDLISGGWKVGICSDNGVSMICDSAQQHYVYMTNITYATQAPYTDTLFVSQVGYTVVYNGPYNKVKSNVFAPNPVGTISLQGHGWLKRASGGQMINTWYDILKTGESLTRDTGSVTNNRVYGYDQWLFMRQSYYGHYPASVKLSCNMTTIFGQTVSKTDERVISTW